jgi:hypothetical protein
VTLQVTDKDGAIGTDTRTIAAQADVSALVRVTYYGGQYDRNTGRTSFYAKLTNISNRPISGPLWMGLLNLAPSTLVVEQANGRMVNGAPYYDLTELTGPDRVLSPDESTTPRVFTLKNPGNVRYTFDSLAMGLPGLPTGAVQVMSANAAGARSSDIPTPVSDLGSVGSGQPAPRGVESMSIVANQGHLLIPGHLRDRTDALAHSRASDRAGHRSRPAVPQVTRFNRTRPGLQRLRANKRLVQDARPIDREPVRVPKPRPSVAKRPGAVLAFGAGFDRLDGPWLEDLTRTFRASLGRSATGSAPLTGRHE